MQGAARGSPAAAPSPQGPAPGLALVAEQTTVPAAAHAIDRLAFARRRSAPLCVMLYCSLG